MNDAPQAEERQRPKVCVIGDSHASVWTELQRRLGRRVEAVRCRIAGMSALGLANPGSRSQAAARLGQFVAQVPAAWLVLVAGQVDCDFVYYYRQLQRPGLSFERQLEASVDAIVRFIQRCLAAPGVSARLPPGRVVLHGVHPPALPSGLHLRAIRHHMQRCQLDRELAEQLTAVPTQAERTRMAMQFNAALGKAAAECGFQFVDCCAELVDPRTGIVAVRYLRQDSYTELEVHLDDEAVSELYLSKYAAIGFPT